LYIQVWRQRKEAFKDLSLQQALTYVKPHCFYARAFLIVRPERLQPTQRKRHELLCVSHGMLFAKIYCHTLIHVCDVTHYRHDTLSRAPSNHSQHNRAVTNSYV